LQSGLDFRYIFKTATANRTVHLLPNGKVRWPYRDSQSGQHKFLELEPYQLISRFLQHVLPRGYCRVRFFGWLHPAAKGRANRVRALLQQKPTLSQREISAWQPPATDDEPPLDAQTTAPASTAPLCPRCQKTHDPDRALEIGPASSGVAPVPSAMSEALNSIGAVRNANFLAQAPVVSQRQIIGPQDGSSRLPSGDQAFHLQRGLWPSTQFVALERPRQALHPILSAKTNVRSSIPAQRLRPTWECR
jgi:hypothetical protein